MPNVKHIPAALVRCDPTSCPYFRRFEWRATAGATTAAAIRSSWSPAIPQRSPIVHPELASPGCSSPLLRRSPAILHAERTSSSYTTKPQQHQTPAPPAYVPSPQPTPQPYPAFPAPTPTAAYAAIPSPAALTPTSLAPSPFTPTPVSPAASGLGVEAKSLAALKKANDMKKVSLNPAPGHRHCVRDGPHGHDGPLDRAGEGQDHQAREGEEPEATVRVGFVGYGDYNNEEPTEVYQGHALQQGHQVPLFHVDDATTRMERRFDQELRKYGSQLCVHSMTTAVADFMPAVIASMTESTTRSLTRG
ncbi:hypothetical protein BJ742DRAFT_451532 [Cladochytrium replicatum]|nr:hypothetical protein BJ742DRAFT_451532 [Cladochytrium replicatum]